MNYFVTLIITLSTVTREKKDVLEIVLCVMVSTRKRKTFSIATTNYG